MTMEPVTNERSNFSSEQQDMHVNVEGENMNKEACKALETNSNLDLVTSESLSEQVMDTPTEPHSAVQSCSPTQSKQQDIDVNVEGKNMSKRSCKDLETNSNLDRVTSESLSKQAMDTPTEPYSVVQSCSPTQSKKSHENYSCGVESCSKLEKKSVRFSSVEIREYPIILGDNAAVSRGPPITIDWQYMTIHHFKTLDEYERTEAYLARRDMSQMAMPLRYRMALLKSSGYSRQQMQIAAKEADLIRSNREKTVQRLQFANYEEYCERIRRLFKNPFSRSKKVDITLEMR